MEDRLTIDEIGFALHLKHFMPHVEDVDWFRISSEDEEYHVYVGRLPEVFVEKRVPTGQFEYKKEFFLLYPAMDMVNSRMSRAKVFMGNDEETLVFRVGISPEDSERFLEGLGHCMTALETAVSEMGHACCVMVEQNEKHEAEEMVEDLQDPFPDNPRTDRKIVS